MKTEDLDRQSEEELVRTALKDNNIFIRVEAAKRIKAPDTLVALAKNDDDGCVGLEVLEKITDGGLLADIAVNGRNKDVRAAAIGRISDPGKLVEIAMTTDRKKEYTAAVNSLTDPVYLREIEENADSIYVRSAAAQRLRELEQDHGNDADEIKRHTEETVSTVTDQTELYNIVMRHPVNNVRRAALLKLTDQQLLAKAAAGHTQARICTEALRRVSDQNMLLFVARNSDRPHIRDKAADSIDNDHLVALINSAPKTFCSSRNLHRLCDEPDKWFNRFTEETVEYVLNLLGRSYDIKISDALILGYRGTGRKLIRDFAAVRIKQLMEHSDIYTGTKPNDYSDLHADYTGDGEYSPPHIDSYENPHYKTYLKSKRLRALELNDWLKKLDQLKNVDT